MKQIENKVKFITLCKRMQLFLVLHKFKNITSNVNDTKWIINVSLGGAFWVAERNKVTVTINKRTYTIVGTESREHVELIAKLVDDKMQEIYESNKHLDSTMLAVLTAINTMNDHVKLKEEFEELLTLIEEEK